MQYSRNNIFLSFLEDTTNIKKGYCDYFLKGLGEEFMYLFSEKAREKEYSGFACLSVYWGAKGFKLYLNLNEVLEAINSSNIIPLKNLNNLIQVLYSFGVQDFSFYPNQVIKRDDKGDIEFFTIKVGNIGPKGNWLMWESKLY